MSLVKVSSLLLLLATSCATEKPKRPSVIEWADSQVFRLPEEAGFQWETLELKEGHFRYWFASDMIVRKPPKYPLEGHYEFKDDQLVLSDGKRYTVREINGSKTLWKPLAVAYWERHQIIHAYGILLPVSEHSPFPSLKPFFTKEQWERSGEQVKRLERTK